MTPTRLVALTVCIALVLARATGVHVHMPTEHNEHVQASLIEHHHDTTVIAAGDEHHDGQHRAHGDVDIGVPDSTTGKLPTMPLLLALLCAAFAMLLPLQGRMAWTQTYRPPARQRWLHRLPPSQGPPHAS